MPNFELVLGRHPDTEEEITLVQITEGDFQGTLIDIEDVRVTAEQELQFTYNLYGYLGEKPNQEALDKVVEEIVYVILENIEQDEDAFTH